MFEVKLEPLGVDAPTFLSTMFAPQDVVGFQILKNREPDPAFTPCQYDEQQGHYARIERILLNHNKEGRGIYFVVNYGGHKGDEIKRINAQFFEIDDDPFDVQLQKINVFPLEPSIVVKTFKSLHTYYLLQTPQSEEESRQQVGRFEYIQKQLVAQFGADASCTNLARVLRVPTFNHCKYEPPTRVEVVHFRPELRYTQEELSMQLPQIADDTNSSTKQNTAIKNFGTQKGLVPVCNCPFIRYCEKNAKTLSEPLWYAMITNLAVFEGGADMIHRLSSKYDKYTFEETQKKIVQFFHTKTKPMTCGKIAECGFDCKKRGKSCKCKSPAALAFKQLSFEDLKRILCTRKAMTDNYQNVKKAEQFINDCLFNVEQAAAYSFIKNHIAPYFSLSKENLKVLYAYHTEVYDQNNSHKAVQKENDPEMFDWYEKSKNGRLKFLSGALAEHLKKVEDVFYGGGDYYYYDGGVYKQWSELNAQKRVREFMHKRYATANEIKDCEYQWRMEVDKSSREINPNSYLINFKNCMFVH
jgi:putative DNA primase/helicase